MTPFVPARSKLEAVSRISALTHSPPETLGPGSKERKSVLQNLARGLGLDVDVSAPKPVLGAQIAHALGVAWDGTCWSVGQTITLDGLNTLLGGGEKEIARRRHAPQLELFEPVTPRAGGFVEARSKLEAVSRISALTHSPPETLGPGSKERKSVLQNLARGLGLDVDVSAPKPVLGAQIAHALGVAWDGTCWSVGQTITLDGLNRLLGGAEARLGTAAVGLFQTAQDEARSLLTALADALPAHMDGRECVAEMKAADYSQWAQDEWVGFYFEYVGLPALINAFGGGPRTVANTRFDYGLGHAWDLKAHMAHSGDAPLNDQQAMQAAVNSASGIGFIVLTGAVEYDDGSFRAWQREFRVRHGKTPRKRSAPARYQRKSKAAFRPGMVEAFFLPDAVGLDLAISAGIVKTMNQGRQVSGRARAPKYSLDLVKARMSDQLLMGQIVL